jgi:colanic acid biosynthesis glycosyl transferase WcaI
MRILIHGINYWPELTSTGKYTGEMVGWLADQGHEVRVVTAPPYYPYWQVEKGYSAWQYRHEYQSRVHVWRCPLWVPLEPTAFKRMLHLASFALSSLPVMLAQIFWKPDIVLVVEPPLFCAPQAWLTARLAGAKAWLHVQDFEVEVFFGLGFASSSLLRTVFVLIESWLMKRFDHVSTISKTMKDRFIRMNIHEDRTSLVPNWVDVSYIHPNPPGRDLRIEWGFLPKQKVVLYAGNMGKKQGLEIIVDVATHMEKTYPDTIFLMVGEGAAKTELEAQVQRQKLKNVRFKPLQPFQDLPLLLAMPDLHLVIQKRGAADAVMPSKLTGILSAGGHAIITADEYTELGQLVQRHPGIAVLVEPENREALFNAIERMMVYLESAGRVNAVARAYAEQYLATDRILQNLEQELFKLAGIQKPLRGKKP